MWRTLVFTACQREMRSGFAPVEHLCQRMRRHGALSRFSGALAGFSLAALLVAPAAAQDHRPLREARSKNGKCVLRIEPGRPERAGRNCTATLYAQAEPGQPRRRLWERPLVNDVAPGQAFVRDDGRFVVTVDEFQRGGAQHALVIYGARGELLRHFLLLDLLESQDWPHIKAASRTLIWMAGAHASFEPQADVFRIELAWARLIRVDLKTLQLIRPDGTPARPELAVIPVDVWAVLAGAAGEETPPMGTPPGELAGLTPADQAQAEAIAQQLSTAQGEATTQAATTREPAAAAAAARAPQPPPSARPPQTAEAIPPLVAEVPAAPIAQEIIAPPPDAEAKTDYVAWLNSFGQLAGNDADDVYQAALHEFAAWPGDEDQFKAAERGDPQALHSRELGAWLETNTDALAAFHEAALCPAKGWNYYSADGSMIGVELPDLGPLRSLAKASLVSGRRLLSEGQAEQAANRYFDVLSAGAHVGSGLTLIENLVGVALQSSAAEALLDLPSSSNGQHLDYAQVAEAAELAARPLRSPREALEAERAFFLDTVQRVWNADPQTGEYVLDRSAARKLLSYVTDEPAQIDTVLDQFALAGYEPTVAEGGLYYDALSDALAQPFRQASAQLRQLESLMADSATANPFLRATTPSVSRFLFVRARGESLRRAAVLTTHLQAYRQEHGAYPAALDELGLPDLAEDPFNSTDFVYERTGDDFRLYSIGGNGQDDGGVHDRKGETNDIVFWPRPR